MKILLSAIACHPGRGSESGVGWKAAAALSKEHTVHVLTSKADREGVELALASGAYPNLSFTFFGTDAPYHENRLVARLQSWQRYVDWMRQSLVIARKMAEERHFDLVHHVTYSSWRIPCQLWQLNLPFVWGPVGGAAVYPLHLLGRLATRSAIFELAREFSNLYASYSKSLKECARNADAVVASNKETFEKLSSLRGSSDGVHLLFPTFFTDQQIGMFRCDPADKSPADPIRLFAGGNIIGSKGLIFALEALQIVAQRGIKWRLVIGGHGPEVPFLEKQARAFGIADSIEFHMGFSGSEYIHKLKESHVFILPSFRENAGITMLEAMLAGCVPVIVDASAQAGVVNDSCGFKIPVGSEANIVKGLASAVCLLAEQHQRRTEMGRAASALVAALFREDSYVSHINKVYADALQQWRGKFER